ncbi:unnamed protein product [Rotaria sp. Silwood2]|nr:unnamed protein product [Rotaria sp. Silwood2]
MFFNRNTTFCEDDWNNPVQDEKLPLQFDGSYFVKNLDDKLLCDLTRRDEIRQLLKHPESNIRHTFSRNTFILRSPIESNIKCKTCSLINDQSVYQWELIDHHASQKYLKLREELKPRSIKRLLKNKTYSINKGYISARLRHLSSFEYIQNSFKKAGDEDNPFYILYAYTMCRNFSTILNNDLARIIIHNLTNSCSRFCCDCLYSTEDGTKSIVTILLYHPQFEHLNFVGDVYRGFVIKKWRLSHYTEGSCIITTTFLSTSKNRKIAEFFSGQDDTSLHTDDISILCIYKINNKDRTALYIAEYSKFQEEEEVLILPYSSFKIMKIVINNEQQ